MTSDRKHTPVTSGAQLTAMRMALAAKRGKIPVSNLKGPSLDMYNGMSEAELERHVNEAEGKKLPEHVRKGKSAATR